MSSSTGTGTNHLPSTIFIPIFVLLGGCSLVLVVRVACDAIAYRVHRTTFPPGVSIACAVVFLFVASRRARKRLNLRRSKSSGEAYYFHDVNNEPSKTVRYTGRSQTLSLPIHPSPHPAQHVVITPLPTAATVSFHSVHTQQHAMPPTSSTTTHFSILPVTPPTSTFHTLSPIISGHSTADSRSPLSTTIPKRVPRRKPKQKSKPTPPPVRASVVWSDTFRRPLRFLSGTTGISDDVDTRTGPRQPRQYGNGGGIDPSGLGLSRDPQWHAPSNWDIVPGDGDGTRGQNGSPTLPMPMPAFLKPAEPVDPHSIDPSKFPMPSDGNPYAKSFRWSASQSSALAGRSSIGGDSVFCTCDLLQGVEEEGETPSSSVMGTRGSDYGTSSSNVSGSNLSNSRRAPVGAVSARSSFQVSGGRCPACRRRSQAANNLYSSQGHHTPLSAASRASSRAGSRVGTVRKPRKSRRHERERQQLKQGSISSSTVVEGRLYQK